MRALESKVVTRLHRAVDDAARQETGVDFVTRNRSMTELLRPESAQPRMAEAREQQLARAARATESRRALEAGRREHLIAGR